MEDDDYLERIEKSYERHTGESWFPEKTLENFPLYGKAKRIEALEQLEGAVKSTTPTEVNMRRYATLTALQREAERLHQMMIRNGK